MKKPFPQERELTVKAARLAELDAALNLGAVPAESETERPENEPEDELENEWLEANP